jgi:hypothetical protein
MYSGESRVAFAAHKEQFGADGGYLGDLSSAPVSCYAKAAATVFAGVVTAFATGAALVAGAHHFGGHDHFGAEAADGGSPIADGSVQTLIDARNGAISAV